MTPPPPRPRHPNTSQPSRPPSPPCPPHQTSSSRPTSPPSPPSPTSSSRPPRSPSHRRRRQPRRTRDSLAHSGELLAESEADAINGCSVMISYSRKGQGLREEHLQRAHAPRRLGAGDSQQRSAVDGPQHMGGLGGHTTVQRLAQRDTQGHRAVRRVSSSYCHPTPSSQRCATGRWTTQ